YDHVVVEERTLPNGKVGLPNGRRREAGVMNVSNDAHNGGLVVVRFSAFLKVERQVLADGIPISEGFSTQPLINDRDAWWALAIGGVDEARLSEPNRHDRRVIGRNGAEVDHERPAIGNRGNTGRRIVQAAQRQLAHHRRVKDPGDLLKARYEIAPKCTQGDS